MKRVDQVLEMVKQCQRIGGEMTMLTTLIMISSNEDLNIFHKDYMSGTGDSLETRMENL